jgi:hypothetical protein
MTPRPPSRRAEAMPTSASCEIVFVVQEPNATIWRWVNSNAGTPRSLLGNWYRAAAMLDPADRARADY